MIPTRLCQQFRNGKLHGFNRKTGSLLVVYREGVYFDQSLSVLLAFNRLTEFVEQISTPECTWQVPSSTDLDSVIESVTGDCNSEILSKIIYFQQWQLTREYFYTSAMDNNALIMNKITFIIEQNRLVYSASCKTQSVLATDGMLLPVHYINGKSF